MDVELIKKERKSNLELLRIVTMIIIIAHHYVVNSGLFDLVTTSNEFSYNNIFLLIFGWGGKTAINCFVLITGYFMCKSHISVKKFIKLIGEFYFYAIIINMIFLLTGYSDFSIKEILKIIFPFFNITTNFTICFILFYLFIPFLNIFIKNINEKEHITLIVLLLIIYTILPTFANANVSFNYITWFIVLYMIASYLRLYSKPFFSSTKLWLILTLSFLLISWISILCIYYVNCKYTISVYPYYFISDSNKFLAVITALSSFMLFKNLNIKQSKIINTIAASTFGVLLIHANSDTMRQWLWKDTLKNTMFYHSSNLYIHAILSV